jgi:Family of unknown function (DUF5762)
MKVRGNDLFFGNNSFDSRKIHMQRESFWLYDPLRTFSPDRLACVLPRDDMSPTERLNAVFRLSVYVGLALALASMNAACLLVPVIVGVATTVMYAQRSGDGGGGTTELMSPPHLKTASAAGTPASQENQHHADATLPTPDNPFGNVLMPEYLDAPDRGPALPASSHEPERTFREHHASPPDERDLFSRGTSSRAFYTMPSTTIPNDRGAFVSALYGTVRRDKDGDSAGLGCPVPLTADERRTLEDSPPPDPATESWWLGSRADTALDPRL